jgi:hypothetical protein
VLPLTLAVDGTFTAPARRAELVRLRPREGPPPYITIVSEAALLFVFASAWVAGRVGGERVLDLPVLTCSAFTLLTASAAARNWGLRASDCGASDSSHLPAACWPLARSTPRRSLARQPHCGVTGAFGLTRSGHAPNCVVLAPQRAEQLFGFSNTIVTIPAMTGVAVTGTYYKLLSQLL